MPTVATRPSVSRANRSAASTNSAAAASASWRMVIGVVPACAASPVNVTVKRDWPKIAVTTPRGTPSATSTGPCSMWTSRYPEAPSNSGAPSSIPTIASSSGVIAPTYARLPRNVD